MAGGVEVRTPGKLMLAGEYAVLQPGGRALAVAVGPSLVVGACPSDEWTFSSPGFGEAGGGLPGPGTLVGEAIEAARAVCGRARLEFGPSRIEVRRALPQHGLGSSAALSVAVIAVSWASAGGELDRAGKATVHRAAHRAHFRAQGRRGSGYDVATVCHGGLLELVRTRGDPELPPSIQPLRWPRALRALRVWTGTAADTRELVHRARACDPSPLADAETAVAGAFEGGSVRAVLDALAYAECTFVEWSERHNLGLVTSEHPAVGRVVGEHALVRRTSGAGGGDSVLLLGIEGEAFDRASHLLGEAGLWVEELERDGEGVGILA